MMQTCAAIPREKVREGMLFVTLTYPREWPGDWHRWKRDLEVFLRRVGRTFPHAGAVWKLEPQRRGAPHFHLVVCGVPHIGKTWLSRSWYEVVGSGDERHLRAGTQVEAVQSHRGVISYAAKYATKTAEAPEAWDAGVGRWWGTFGRQQLGVCYERQPLSKRGYWRARRVLRAIRRSRDHARGIRRDRPPGRCAWLVLDDRQAARVYAWAET
jgi:hypothetical protein